MSTTSDSRVDVTRIPQLRALDTAAIEAMLHSLHPRASVRSVRVIERARCGDGIASTADRVVLDVNLASVDAGDIPTRMIVKTLLLNPMLRLGLPAILSLSRVSRMAEELPLVGRSARSFLFVVVGAFQRICPQAPDAMYRNEVRFYTEIRPNLRLEAPRCFGGLFDERTRQFGLLLEDLTQRGARFPNATTDVTLEEIRSLLTALATLHAEYWQSRVLETELAWVPTRLQGGMFPVFDGIGRELVRYQVEQHLFKQALLRPLGRTVDELWAALWRSQQILDSGPRTLLHGDPHIGNTYLLPGAVGGLLDWQLMARGHWANDVAYLIATALSPEARARHERDLLEFYVDALGRAGVTERPSREDAWRAYRLAIIWGIVIGWLITPPVNYGEAITSANIERLVRAACELESFQAVARG